MRFWKIFSLATAVMLTTTFTNVASASQTRIVEEIIAGNVYVGDSLEPSVFFTRNGNALISVPGVKDELVKVEVDDDDSIAFIDAETLEFRILWHLDETQQAIVSGDRRLQLIKQGTLPSR